MCREREWYQIGKKEGEEADGLFSRGRSSCHFAVEENKDSENKRKQKYQDHRVKAIRKTSKLNLTRFCSVVVFWLMCSGQQVKD